MKIQGWHIDGFGNFHDEGVTNLSGRLVVVSGPNEAGKSTLAHFLGGMLFGFPDHRSKGPHHPPLRGGSLGGTLTLDSPVTGRVTVARGQQRSSLRLTDTTGTSLPVGTLDTLLGHASAELFDNVFAVDLRDLVELRALSNDQVRDRIYSAGVLGAGRSARAAIDALEKQRDALLKPNGRGASYRLNQLRDRLREVAEELTALRAAAAKLGGQREVEAAHASRIAALDTHLGALTEEQELLRAVQALWEPWQEAQRAREGERQRGPLPELAPQFAGRLEAAHNAAEAAAADHDEANATLDERQLALSSIEVDHAALALRHRAAALGAALGAEEERQAQQQRLLGEVAEHRAALHQHLARFGPGLDEVWLAVQPATVTAVAELRAEAAQVSGAIANTERARERHDLAANSIATVDNLAAHTVARVDDEPGSAAGPGTDPVVPLAAPAARLTALLRLQSLVEEIDRRPPATAGAPLPPAALAVLGAGALSSLACGAFGMIGGIPALVVAGLVLLTLAMAAGAAMLTAPRLRPAARPSPGTAEVPTAELTSQLLAELGLDAMPTLGDVRLLVHHATEAARRAERAAEARIELNRLQTQLRAAEQAERDALTRWRAWLVNNGLPAQLDPEGAGDYLRTLEATREAHHALLRSTENIQTLNAASAAFAAEVATLASELAVPGDDEPRLVAAAIVARCRSAAEAAAGATSAQRRAEDAAHDLERAGERLRAAGAAISVLLEEAGAQTVEEARAVLAAVTAHQSRCEVIEAFENQLAMRCGARAEEARSLLGEADPGAWTGCLQGVDARQREAKAERDTLLGDLRDLETARRLELDSARIPELEQEQAGLLADLRAAAERWRELSVAKELLEATLARYQRERQPAVVKRAERYFSQVTGGRYPHLRLDEGEVCAVDKVGRAVDAAALSRGTTDQLYLSLRFALAGAFAEASPLPLLLDDVLVNVDGNRSPQLASVIAEVAKHHQVFLFTCHPWMVELLTAVEPTLQHVQLPGSA